MSITDKFLAVKAYHTSQKSVGSLIWLNSQWVGTWQYHLAVEVVYSFHGLISGLEIHIGRARK